MRVRFAPSPTGFLHLGGMRTALFNYLLARSSPGGKLILRIEDTDRRRNVPGAVESLIGTLQWLGLRYDEGPGAAGTDSSSKYIQSQRLDIYSKYADHLLSAGKAYKCYCPKERKDDEGDACNCKDSGKASEYGSFAVRLSAPSEAKPLSFIDANYGEMAAPEMPRGAVLVKSDGFPTYHFASVVDDHEMRIDVVMRGQEWLPSTFTHLAVYSAFGWRPPVFCHLPLLLAPDRSKLSKRDNSSRVEWYQQNGFFPEALLNFAAFLGWTPSVHFEGNREIITMDEMIETFRTCDLNRSDSVVDIDRLRWFNRKHLESRDSTALAEKLLEKAPNITMEQAVQICELMKGRVSAIDEIQQTHPFFFCAPHPPVVPDCAKVFLRRVLHKLRASDDYDVADITRDYSKVQKKENMAVLRYVITGQSQGPPLSLIMPILGRAELVARLGRSV